ncbi:unnamed protein product, partial [Porites evermanni]
MCIAATSRNIKVRRKVTKSEESVNLSVVSESSIAVPPLRLLYRFKRCWHAKTHGWAAFMFHGNCDEWGSTVTIIQVGNYMFGGCSDVSWYAIGSCRYGDSSKAFIYSLSNNSGSGYAVYNSVKLNVK